MPVELVTVWRISPVSRFRIWIVALGIMAPLGSCTDPLICAKSYCANNCVLATRPIRQSMRARTKLLLFFKNLASPLETTELIFGICLFIFDLLQKDDRGRA